MSCHINDNYLHIYDTVVKILPAHFLYPPAAFTGLAECRLFDIIHMLHVPILDLIYAYTDHADVNDNCAVTTAGGNGQKIEYKLGLQPQ